MPGPISDSRDPEFGTGDNADAVRQAVRLIREKLTRRIGTESLKDIVGVAHRVCERQPTRGWSEDEMRVLRFCLDRCEDTI